MKNVASVIKHDTSLSVCFYVDQEHVMQVGENMNKLHEDAYMNGYNWEVFLDYYLTKHHPELLEGMGTDPEAGMYCAYYDLNPANEKKAEQLVDIIQTLVTNEQQLYDIVKNEGDEIEWD